MEFDDKNQLELPFYKVNILCAKICCLTKNLAINNKGCQKFCCKEFNKSFYIPLSADTLVYSHVNF